MRIVNCNEDSDWRLPCERAGEPFPKGGKINNVVPKMTRCRHAMTLVRLPIGMWTVQSSSEPHSHSSGLSTGCAPFSLALTSEQNEYIEAQIRLPVPPGSKAIKDLFAKRWPETPITSKLLRARLQRVGRYQRKIAEEIADVYRMLKAKYGIIPDNMTAVTEGSGEAVETVGREREDHIEEVIDEGVGGDVSVDTDTVTTIRKRTGVEGSEEGPSKRARGVGQGEASEDDGDLGGEAGDAGGGDEPEALNDCEHL